MLPRKPLNVLYLSKSSLFPHNLIYSRRNWSQVCLMPSTFKHVMHASCRDAKQTVVLALDHLRHTGSDLTLTSMTRSEALNQNKTAAFMFFTAVKTGFTVTHFTMLFLNIKENIRGCKESLNMSVLNLYVMWYYALM